MASAGERYRRAVERILNVGPDQYAIGRFRLIEGVPANCVARRVGDTWSALPPIVDDPGYLLDAIEYQGDLVVAGTHINPHDPALSYITRWDGVEWRPVGALLVHMDSLARRQGRQSLRSRRERHRRAFRKRMDADCCAIHVLIQHSISCSGAA